MPRPRMPNKLRLKICVSNLVSTLFPAMFLVCKFHEYKRQQQEQNRRKVTEKELSNLNHKIDKLLNRLEEHEPELATSPDDECVICISAKATMQTFPCGHRVVCRKCFVKTIQVAVSQRLLPLRCVICRAKILRLKQTTHGGIDTGTVLRSRAAAAGHTVAAAAASNLSNNPFYISPATSPVSPVTEVFREQRAVWVKHYDDFGYGPSGQSPDTTPTTPEAISKSQGTGCVLHKHCNEKSKQNVTSPSGSASIRSSGSSSPASNISSSPSTSKAMVTTLISPSTSGTALGSPSTSGPYSPSNKVRLSSGHHQPRLTPNPWQWQFNRKKRHRLAHRRRHGNLYGSNGRPNSLLLPIDERDELQDLISENGREGSGSSGGDEDQMDDIDEKTEMLPKSTSTSSIHSKLAPKAEPDDDSETEDEFDKSSQSSSGNTSNKSSFSRRASTSGLLSHGSTSFKISGSSSFSSASSRIATTLLKAKNLMSKGKWSIY